MRNKEKNSVLFIIGVFSFILVAVASNSANAVKNNLLIKNAETASAPAGAFLVSMPNNKEAMLKKYENATKLTDHELVHLLRLVGFQGKALKTAWAIAKRESNGQPIRFNGNVKTGDSSYGLFQINMIGSLGPDRREKYNLDSNAELFNPVTNAKIAFAMTQGGQDWSSWKGLTPRALEWLKKYPAISGTI